MASEAQTEALAQAERMSHEILKWGESWWSDRFYMPCPSQWLNIMYMAREFLKLRQKAAA
jgi:hypothetical protein